MAPSGKAQMKTQKWEKCLTSPVIIKAFGQHQQLHSEPENKLQFFGGYIDIFFAEIC